MIDIEFDSTTVLQALSELSQRASDLRQPLDDIGQTLEDMTALSFSDASDPYGAAWKPLKYRDGVPLNDTGLLKNSLTHNVLGDSVEIGTAIEYAPTHQYGKQSVPARPFLPTSEGGLPSDWEEEVLDIINSHLEEAIN